MFHNECQSTNTQSRILPGLRQLGAPAALAESLSAQTCGSAKQQPILTASKAHCARFPFREQRTMIRMRIIARSRLREFWERHAASRAPLSAWFNDVKTARWRTPQDVCARQLCGRQPHCVRRRWQPLSGGCAPQLHIRSRLHKVRGHTRRVRPDRRSNR